MPTEIILSRTGDETWIAVRKDGRVAEIFVDRERQRSLVGNIYKGRVKRVIPGMQAAFVDIGLDRHAFLYVGDLPGAEPRGRRRASLAGDADEDGALAREGEGREEARPPTPDIRDLIRQGQDIVVQVSKDPFGTKGPRATGILTLAGRSVVLLPEVEHVGVSRRIEDHAERERLRAAVEAHRPPGGGVIVRTVAEGESEDRFRREVEALRDEWSSVMASAAAGRSPTLLRRELDLPLKVLRDHASPELERIVTDCPDLAEACREFAGRIAPEVADRIVMHDEPVSLLDVEGVAQAVRGALKARVWLKSGGYLVINPTEALVAIDVNSGRYLGRKDLEDTALSINLEAAREVARQIRLRDLAGIIVVDFIDMTRERSRRLLLDEAARALRADRARTRMLGLSEFGLLALTRKRTRVSLERSLCRPVPTARAAGACDRRRRSRARWCASCGASTVPAGACGCGFTPMWPRSSATPMRAGWRGSRRRSRWSPTRISIARPSSSWRPERSFNRAARRAAAVGAPRRPARATGPRRSRARSVGREPASPRDRRPPA
jgi:ribonuclease G